MVVCPITHNEIRHAVITPCFHICEQSALMSYIQNNHKCPVCSMTIYQRDVNIATDTLAYARSLLGRNVEQLECPITTDPITTIGITPCFHKFEKYAILEWLQTTHACPLCRIRICIRDVHVATNIYTKSILGNQPQNTLSLQIRPPQSQSQTTPTMQSTQPIIQPTTTPINRVEISTSTTNNGQTQITQVVNGITLNNTTQNSSSSVSGRIRPRWNEVQLQTLYNLRNHGIRGAKPRGFTQICRIMQGLYPTLNFTPQSVRYQYKKHFNQQV